ncbi:MAG: hypothetical protein ACIAS6_12235 [Phycisphaerales bacterium JB060]
MRSYSTFVVAIMFLTAFAPIGVAQPSTQAAENLDAYVEAMDSLPAYEQDAFPHRIASSWATEKDKVTDGWEQLQEFLTSRESELESLAHFILRQPLGVTRYDNSGLIYTLCAEGARQWKLKQWGQADLYFAASLKLVWIDHEGGGVDLWGMTRLFQLEQVLPVIIELYFGRAADTHDGSPLLGKVRQVLDARSEDDPLSLGGEDQATRFRTKSKALDRRVGLVAARLSAVKSGSQHLQGPR